MRVTMTLLLTMTMTLTVIVIVIVIVIMLWPRPGVLSVVLRAHRSLPCSPNHTSGSI